jgi:hypothetical protein
MLEATDGLRVGPKGGNLPCGEVTLTLQDVLPACSSKLSYDDHKNWKDVVLGWTTRVTELVITMGGLGGRGSCMLLLPSSIYPGQVEDVVIVQRATSRKLSTPTVPGDHALRDCQA